MTRLGVSAGVLAFLMIAAACNRSEELVPITSIVPPTTAVALTPATTEPATATSVGGAPGTTLVVKGIPSYRIVQLVPSDEGDHLVVLLDPGEYDDVDIELLMEHLVDEHQPDGAHVVDDAESAELVLEPDADVSAVPLVDHYLAKLDGGNKVTYMGPLAEFGIFYVGS